MKYTACFRVLLARDKHLEWGNSLLHISLLNSVILDSRSSKAFEQNHVLIPRHRASKTKAPMKAKNSGETITYE